MCHSADHFCSFFVQFVFRRFITMIYLKKKKEKVFHYLHIAKFVFFFPGEKLSYFKILTVLQ